MIRVIIIQRNCYTNNKIKYREIAGSRILIVPGRREIPNEDAKNMVLEILNECNEKHLGAYRCHEQSIVEGSLMRKFYRIPELNTKDSVELLSELKDEGMIAQPRLDVSELVVTEQGKQLCRRLRTEVYNGHASFRSYVMEEFGSS